MTTLLQINASINNDNGQSSQLANRFVAAFRSSHPDAAVIVRDVASGEAVPHLTAERFGAFDSFCACACVTAGPHPLTAAKTKIAIHLCM